MVLLWGSFTAPKSGEEPLAVARAQGRFRACPHLKLKGHKPSKQLAFPYDAHPCFTSDLAGLGSALRRPGVRLGVPQPCLGALGTNLPDLPRGVGVVETDRVALHTD